jgi:hypothetical protein
MHRILLAALAVALVLPATASARIIEIGDIGTPATPSCPTTPCEVISRTTAYQTRIGAERDMFVVPRDGRIVAWSITLGTPAKRQLKFFTENLGGAAQAGISVLRTGKKMTRRVTAASPAETLTPYFGQTVQFPLITSLPVVKGQLIALSVPTWAPALALGVGNDNIWRASRDVEGCDDTQTQSVQAAAGDLATYKCFYRTARLAYSATLVTTPVVPKEPKPKQPRRAPRN